VSLSQRDYLEEELRSARWRLADVEAPSRQTKPTEEGRAFRQRLRDEIADLERRLASEDA
jgi:hypothetical protein